MKLHPIQAKIMREFINNPDRKIILKSNPRRPKFPLLPLPFGKVGGYTYDKIYLDEYKEILEIDKTEAKE